MLACDMNISDLVRKVEAELGPFDPRHLAALRDVPRARFVRPIDLELANEDMPLPLDDSGLATISAPHAYLLSYRLLALAPGDHLVELGSGSGYGAALASYIVGPHGSVLSFEIDADLAQRATALLANVPNARVMHLDAMKSTPSWGDAHKITCTFAVHELPRVWLDALRPGSVLAAPVGAFERQRLVRVVRDASGALHETEHGGVRYVPNRSSDA
jgi:protein-L-isoaspartate(D-aspartate) O-methyltransferase